MDQRSDRFYPSVPLENNDLEQRLRKKLTVYNNFNYHVNNIKEMITYFKDKNHESKEKYKNFKIRTTILESVDSIFIIGPTSTSITLPITGIGLIVLPISVGIACTLSLFNKVLLKLIINKCNKYKKQYEKDEQTNRPFDSLYRKAPQDNVYY